MTTQYTAVIASSRIITVTASSVDEARAIIRAELSKNPSRRPYLAAWEASGQKVIWTDGSGSLQEATL